MDVQASLATSLKGSLRDAAKHNHTQEGSRTWQTILMAAAHDDGDEASTVTGKRKADFLEVREEAFYSARNMVSVSRTENAREVDRAERNVSP